MKLMTSVATVFDALPFAQRRTKAGPGGFQIDRAQSRSGSRCVGMRDWLQKSSGTNPKIDRLLHIL